MLPDIKKDNKCYSKSEKKNVYTSNRIYPMGHLCQTNYQDESQEEMFSS